jgi:hypothetical protein
MDCCGAYCSDVCECLKDETGLAEILVEKEPTPKPLGESDSLQARA